MDSTIIRRESDGSFTPGGVLHLRPAPDLLSVATGCLESFDLEILVASLVCKSPTVAWFDTSMASSACHSYGIYEQPLLFRLYYRVVYGIIFFLVYHQYSLVNEIGPPHKQDAFA